MLPAGKTRAGKVLRATMKQPANGEDYKVPPIIDDPDILIKPTRSLPLDGPMGAIHSLRD